MYNIELNIDELVLHGFSPHDRYRIAEAVEHELARIITEQGFSPSLLQNSELDRLDGGSFEVQPDAKPEQIGSKVAQAVYGGLVK
jgi:hypothetical protein